MGHASVEMTQIIFAVVSVNNRHKLWSILNETSHAKYR